MLDLEALLKNKDILDRLTEREAVVIRLRYGLDNGISRTLEEVAREFNISEKAVLSIEKRALAKLENILTNM